jgi:thiol-disulfide isomerase/thioredoxin
MPTTLTGPTDYSPRPTAEPRKRPTWRDLDATVPPAAKVPISVQAAPALAERSPLDPETIVTSRSSPRDEPRSVRGRPRAAPRVALASCQYDPKQRRIVDFRLPNLEGRPVRFQDFEADFILLDFWGTWCAPCMYSIPHLIDLQQRLGERRLKVVGIACEQGTPQQQAANVARTVKRLGINYPVLLSGLEGDCPLQNALHIQAFPTLILVDRQGRLLWRDQGSMPPTLARLDRVLESAAPSSTVRR